MTEDLFCHNKHVFVATKMILVAAPTRWCHANVLQTNLRVNFTNEITLKATTSIRKGGKLSEADVVFGSRLKIYAVLVVSIVGLTWPEVGVRHGLPRCLPAEEVAASNPGSVPLIRRPRGTGVEPLVMEGCTQTSLIQRKFRDGTHKNQLNSDGRLEMGHTRTNLIQTEG